MTPPDDFITLDDDISEVPNIGVKRTLSDRINATMFWKFRTRQCVYFIGNLLFVKIGYTTNVARRLTDLDAMSPVPLFVLLLAPGDFTQEGDFHERFADYSIRGEWFRHDGKLAEFIARERVRFA